ncbi:hypothetical protein MKZ38_002297 [Zalerion maritima]|uniref:Mitochondrial inner membrane protein 1 n=1 Tax=Zalerion maritima TaxID=339359 RepID=A0AAD5WSI4_9PEZI|nr:hypothetical protein MKZ38_002297 [Zalerion maritima]
MFRSASTGLRRATPGLIRHQPVTARPSPSWQLPIRNSLNAPRLAKPLGFRVYTAEAGFGKRDKKLEEEMAKKKLQSNPSEVSTTSSVRPLMEHSQNPEPMPDMSESLKHDINIIVDTVALRSVPKEAHLLGLAGTLPYLATSITTLYLGWDLNQTWAPGVTNMFMLTHDHAHQLLTFLEPIQLGYGAVIISFLGAIHWGMQFNEHNPTKEQTRFRYAMGVISPAVAWPTILMPFEYALMSQMMAFTLLYFADTTASTKAWAPAWYGNYRFVLTFVVCTAIVLSLVGRQKIAGGGGGSVLSGDEIKKRGDMGAYNAYSEKKSPKWERIEKEEVEKRKKEEVEKRKKEEEAAAAKEVAKEAEK